MPINSPQTQKNSQPSELELQKKKRISTNRRIMGIEFIAILLIAMTLVGINFLFNNKPNTAKASEYSSSSSNGNSADNQANSQSDENLSEDDRIKKRVRDNPDAGLEAIDKETLDRSKFFINTLPRFVVEKEVNSQLKDGYITQKQHDEFIRLLDEKEGK